MLTREVGVLGQLLQPGAGHDDGLFLRVVLRSLEPVLVRLLDDIGHVLPPEGGQHAEEEVPLRQLVGQLLPAGQVLGKHLVLHGVVEHVLDRQLRVAGHFDVDHLVGLEVELALLEDVAHEVERGPLQAWEEDSD